MICQLNPNIKCKGNREAVYRIEWGFFSSDRYDPTVSYICEECLEGRPSSVMIFVKEKL